MICFDLQGSRELTHADSFSRITTVCYSFLFTVVTYAVLCKAQGYPAACHRRCFTAATPSVPNLRRVQRARCRNVARPGLAAWASWGRQPLDSFAVRVTLRICALRTRRPSAAQGAQPETTRRNLPSFHLSTLRVMTQPHFWIHNYGTSPCRRDRTGLLGHVTEVARSLVQC